MKNPMSLIVMNIVATIMTIIFNTLSVTLPIGVATTADIANSVPIRFFPATITFSIWGVIYIGWIIFTVYQALPAQRSNPFVRAVGWWYVLGSLGNMGWLLLFQNLQFATSTLPIVFLLVTLGIIYVNLRRVNAKPTRGDIWAIFVPFSVYFAWAAVANVANLTYVLFPGEGELWLGLTHERAFGFSRQSGRDFALDRLKAVAIGAALTGAALAGLVLALIFIGRSSAGADTRTTRVWAIETLLGSVALAAAAFLRWFS